MPDLPSRFSTEELPVELLCSIFLLCCEIVAPKSTASWPQEDSPHIYAFRSSDPTVLTQVSKHWRDVATQLQPLWSFIKITKDTSLAMIPTWLERSGTHPLDIVINTDRLGCHDSIYGLLLPHILRWREFHIEVPVHDVNLYHPLTMPAGWQVSKPLPTTTPLELRTIELRNVGYLHVREDLLLYHLIISNRRLMRLVMIESPCHWGRFTASLEQLTWFEISQHKSIKQEAYFGHLMRAIGLMSSLEDLRVTVSDNYEPDLVQAIGHPMTLLNLQTFKLHLLGPCASLWAWLININAPRLWKLQIWHESFIGYDSFWHDGLDEHDWGLFQGAIHLPSLTDFHWIPDVLERCGEGFAALLFVIPSIIRLTVEDSKRSYEFPIQRIFPSSCRLPHLECVTIKGWKTSEDVEIIDRSTISDVISKWNSRAVVVFEDLLS